MLTWSFALNGSCKGYGAAAVSPRADNVFEAYARTMLVLHMLIPFLTNGSQTVDHNPFWG